MNIIFRNVLAVIAGLFVGGLVNMGIVILSGYIIPPPAGVNVEDARSIAEHIHLYEPKHFIMPFLAHALGTLSGAFLASKIASTNQKLRLAMIVGLFFLIGGYMAVRMIPAPMWFNILDLAGAYLPMAYLGYHLGRR